MLTVKRGKTRAVRATAGPSVLACVYTYMEGELNALLSPNSAKRFYDEVVHRNLIKSEVSLCLIASIVNRYVLIAAWTLPAHVWSLHGSFQNPEAFPKTLEKSFHLPRASCCTPACTESP